MLEGVFDPLILQRRLEPREVKQLTLGHTASSGYDLEHYHSPDTFYEKHKSGRVNVRLGGNCSQTTDIIGRGVDAC